MSQLRKQIGHSRIETRSPGYRIVVEPGELDLDRFRSLRAEAEASEPEAAVAKLSEALSLWRGPPLADLTLEGFAEYEIAQLEELRLAAVEARIEAELLLEGSTDLVAELERLARDHPLRERFHAQLILALYRSGRQADALDAYRTARTTLVEELGIEPSIELKELERKILSQDASLAIPATTGARRRRSEDDALATQEVRFLEIDGSTLACVVSGDGPPVVVPCWWIADVERELEWPSLGRFITELGRTHTIVRYNRPDSPQRGQARLPQSLETEVRLLGGVLDQLAVGPATLLGVSCGACAAMGLAATRPDLVDALVLYAPFVNGAELATPELRASLTSLVRAHWGVGSNVLSDLAMPDAPPADRSFFNELQQRTASETDAAEWLEYVYGLDVSHTLERIDARVLVLHRRGDRMIPFVNGRDVAARVSAARFIPLTGRDHFPWIGDTTSLLGYVTSFLDARSETLGLIVR